MRLDEVSRDLRKARVPGNPFSLVYQWVIKIPCWDIPGAYEQAFKFDLVRDDDEESDSELEPLIEGMADVKLSKETLKCIREPWSNARIDC